MVQGSNSTKSKDPARSDPKLLSMLKLKLLPNEEHKRKEFGSTAVGTVRPQGVMLLHSAHSTAILSGEADNHATHYMLRKDLTLCLNRK